MENYFVGTYRHSIDDKGRTSVPAKFRQVLDSSTIDGRVFFYPLAGRIGVYPPSLIGRISDSFADANFLADEAIKRMRVQASKFEEVKFDKQGRMCIPSVFRDAAGLTNEIVFVGCFKMFEIWSLAAWLHEGEGGGIHEAL